MLEIDKNMISVTKVGKAFLDQKEERMILRNKNMIKKISDMTAADKADYLEKVKLSLLLEQGVSWEFMEAKIQEEIDSTFDDEKFAKMDPDSRIDAAYARKEFGDKKPEIVDYLLWMGKFVTKSDYVEW